MKLGRVMIVDDEKNLLDVLAEAITGLGFDVTSSEEPVGALTKIGQGEFDILLTDLVMPGMSGTELFRQARELDPHLVGIVMTANATVQTAVEGMQLGIFDYLVKPFTAASLAPVLQRALDVRRLRLENIELRQTVAMYELSQVVGYSLATNVILDKVIEGALQQCKADEASIMLPDHDARQLYVAAVLGAGREGILGMRVPMDRYVAGWVAGNRQPLVLDGEVSDPRFTPHSPRPDITRAASLPLLAGGKLVGIMNLNFTRPRRPLSAGEIKALNIFASIAAAALESARAHETLEREKCLLAAVIDNVPDLISFKDRPGRYVMANAALCSFVGVPSPAAMVGKTDEEIFSRETAAQIRTRDADATRSGGRSDCEESLVSAGGTPHIFLASRLVLTGLDAVEGLVCIQRDITESKAAQREVESLSRFPEENPNPVMRFSAEGRLLYANPRSMPFLDAWACRLGDSMPTEHASLVKRAMEAGVPVETEIPLGDRLFTLLAAPVVACRYVNLYAVDVTDKKSLERQVLQAQKMEVVGRLAGGVAHDYNNILTAIIGYADFLLLKLGEGSPLGREVREIRKAGMRAAVVTQQLLAFSRQQVFSVRVLDLNALIQDLEKMLRRFTSERISLALHLDPSLGRVRVDASRMEQVLLNLVINACDAMPEGGSLVIETASVMLEESYTRRHMSVSPGPHVLLAVSDTGVGMSEEIRAHMFEPFFTTKEQGKGTGLGLSTVYGIVKQSNGNIWVYSEPGKGTAFKIYLPCVTDPLEAVPAERDSEGEPTGTETVLVVEDEQAIREIVTMLLSTRGYTVLQARDGEEALRADAGPGGRLHMLLTDVVLPGMGGVEIHRRLAALHPGLRVLFMSGYTTNGIVHNGVLAAEVAFLQKPFTSHQLLNKVREVLDGPPTPPLSGSGGAPGHNTESDRS
jgi:PAS domain S-box-containing protein